MVKEKGFATRGIASLDGVSVEQASLKFIGYIPRKGKPEIVWNSLSQAIAKDLVKDFHAQKLKKAFAGDIQQYCWSEDTKPAFYQTTLLPLLFISKKPLVLMTVREIKLGKVPTAHSLFLRETNEQQLTVAQLLLSAREEEKRKISKSLHDELGSAAVILTSLLSLVRLQIEKNQKKKALAQLQELDGQIKNCIGRLKNIVVSLRPPSLEQEGALCGFIGELLENVSRYANIPFTFDCKDAGEQGVSDSVKITLYRVVQEALNNIVKHAKAKHIYVSLHRKEASFYLTIQDDGVGFRKKSQHSIRSMGLLAMKESVRSLGGTISIKSTLGKGTCIKVVCPCAVYEEEI